MRLIDADALIEKHPEICSRSMKFNLDLAPTIDAVPVVHAKYGFVGPDLSVCRYDLRYGTCSSCKERILFSVKQKNFCPNCGARMDGEADD